MSELATVYFVVEGSGAFPFDMLRYDECHPVHEHEANRLGDITAAKTIVLASRARERSWRPTTARWRVRGWYVKAVSDLKPTSALRHVPKFMSGELFTLYYHAGHTFEVVATTPEGYLAKRNDERDPRTFLWEDEPDMQAVVRHS